MHVNLNAVRHSEDKSCASALKFKISIIKQSFKRTQKLFIETHSTKYKETFYRSKYSSHYINEDLT